MNATEIANTTWKQIPVMTKMACGVREPHHDADGALTFKVGGKPMRFVTVTLNQGLDLYEVEYFRIQRGTYKRVSLESVSGVFCSDLGEVIYHMVNK